MPPIDLFTTSWQQFAGGLLSAVLWLGITAGLVTRMLEGRNA